MGFGLHFGWAIQGAFGSQWKIDASYLSPNILIAKQICEATEVYGVKLMATSELYKQLSPEFKKMMLVIDRVTVKGHPDPLELYTMTIEEEQMTSENDKYFGAKYNTQDYQDKKTRHKEEHDSMVMKVSSKEFTPIQIFERDGDIMLLRKNAT